MERLDQLDVALVCSCTCNPCNFFVSKQIQPPADSCQAASTGEREERERSVDEDQTQPVLQGRS